ncbi:uncharacterized protein N7496_010208 [Penicillium cataractarum]|uniref:Uncharacterized protein n=1 Tax=Penicillium cataractarum TaxID=2100454 RepID=A0A9W9V2W1_9EURO|nr:uncharacterized protein N7496_010208 [Penicillium cataractarum]KAJ5364495.1 hypothetical protein N7496_010208 [Penicillium cataractarum]
MQFKLIIATLSLALLSGTVTAQSQSAMHLRPTQSPAPSAIPSIPARRPLSRSARPTLSPTVSSFTGSSTAAPSMHRASTPASPSGFTTSAIPAGSGSGSEDILGSLLGMARK